MAPKARAITLLTKEVSFQQRQTDSALHAMNNQWVTVSSHELGNNIRIRKGSV